MIQFNTGASLTGREFKLQWTIDGDDQFAQVKFIEIDYIPDNSVIELCTDFSSCSETCGGGTQTCENTCQNGVFGDDGCPLESKTNSQDCNLQDCPGKHNIVRFSRKIS